MSLELLTAISTTFIVASGASLLLGWFFIRRRRIGWHRNAMLSATGFAGLFLVAYLTRWSTYGSKAFEGTGWWKVLYLATLVPHIVMAMLVGPLAARLIYLALSKEDFAAHRRLARITLPIWIYVAASGWAIYFMLYRMEF